MPKTTKYLANWLTLYELFPDKDQIPKEQFRLVLRLFHNLVCREIFNGRFVKLPQGAGILGCFKKQAPIPDYVLLDKHDIRANMKNLHTEGYTVVPT